jgi:acetoin utilization deacetylase AcuC-like enzyme
MKTFYNQIHARHQGQFEMYRGSLVPCFEVAARADRVLLELKARPVGQVLEPQQWDDAVLASVHSERYLRFLRTAWAQWLALDPTNAGKDILPAVWPTRAFRSDHEPANFSGRLGLYSFDAGTPVTAGTWEVAREGAMCAVSAAQAVLEGDRAAFSLSRPPGHHAGIDFFGGYCFLNNAALAAQHLRLNGCGRVAVLDIDYHHGNGTQSVFYERADVFFASIHGDPRTEYPFFLGHADEAGASAGLGTNLNLPLPRGTEFSRWSSALKVALSAVAQFRADALVVSLGLDTFENDPISGFKLKKDDYYRIGETLAKTGLPVVFVFEGGYAVDEVGVVTVNVLQGFASN